MVTGAGDGAAIENIAPVRSMRVDGPGTGRRSMLSMNNAATIPHMSGGQFQVPLVIRMATGAGRQLAGQHSHSFEGWYAHIPGLRIVYPSNAADAKGLLKTACRLDDELRRLEAHRLRHLLAQVEGRLVGADHVDQAGLVQPGHRGRHNLRLIGSMGLCYGQE